MRNRYIEHLEEINGADYGDLPLLVLSTSFTGIFSYFIRLRTHAIYSHFMWLHAPGKFASQQAVFKELSLQHFVNAKLKFIRNPHWNNVQRAMLTERIYAELERPKWRTRYDWINIIGQLFGIKSLQNPSTNICSETAGFLKLVDQDYDLDNPTPDELNKWLNQNPNYELYARYSPD